MLTNFVTEVNILLGITVAKDRRQRRFVSNSLKVSCPVIIASNLYPQKGLTSTLLCTSTTRTRN